jgi:hypothetical protein
MRLAAGILLLSGLVFWCPALSAGKASMPEGRKRAVELARQLEEDPLGPNAEERRAELLKWWTTVSDQPLNWCADMLAKELKGADRDLAIAVSLQAPLSAAAAMIERPELAKDKKALAVAGIEGALRAYRSVISKEPGRKNEFLEGLQKEGALETYVDSKLPSCK